MAQRRQRQRRRRRSSRCGGPGLAPGLCQLRITSLDHPARVRACAAEAVQCAASGGHTSERCPQAQKQRGCGAPGCAASHAAQALSPVVDSRGKRARLVGQGRTCCLLAGSSGAPAPCPATRSHSNPAVPSTGQRGFSKAGQHTSKLCRRTLQLAAAVAAMATGAAMAAQRARSGACASPRRQRSLSEQKLQGSTSTTVVGCDM